MLWYFIIPEFGTVAGSIGKVIALFTKTSSLSIINAPEFGRPISTLLSAVTLKIGNPDTPPIDIKSFDKSSSIDNKVPESP